MLKLLKKILSDEKGASLAEYAVLLAVITAGTIVAIQTLGTDITKAMGSVTQYLNP